MTLHEIGKLNSVLWGSENSLQPYRCAEHNQPLSNFYCTAVLNWVWICPKSKCQTCIWYSPKYSEYQIIGSVIGFIPFLWA